MHIQPFLIVLFSYCVQIVILANDAAAQSSISPSVAPTSRPKVTTSTPPTSTVSSSSTTNKSPTTVTSPTSSDLTGRKTSDKTGSGNKSQNLVASGSSTSRSTTTLSTSTVTPTLVTCYNLTCDYDGCLKNETSETPAPTNCTGIYCVITIDHEVNQTIASCNSTCTPQRDGDVLDYCCQTELCNDDENKMFETTTITASHTPTTTPYENGAARKNLELLLTGFMLLMIKVILFQ